MTTRTAVMRARRAGRRARWYVFHSARKLGTLPLAEWRYLLHAQFNLLWAQALVWIRPLGGLVDSRQAPGAPSGGGAPANAAPGTGAGRVPPLEPVDPLPRQLALGVRRAAAYGVFRPLCLVRSVALNRMLDQYGFHGSRIRVGVRLVDGKFAAHAWVEYEGQVLGDDVEHVSGFAELSDVRLLKWS